MSSYSEDILATSGLQSFWKLGEASGHFADSKGSVNSTSEAGVIYGATSLLTNETKDKALKYDNTGTPRVKFGNNYQFAGTEPYSIEFWYKPETVEGIADILSYAKANGGENYEEGYIVARFTSGLYIIRKGAFKTDVTGIFEANKTYHIVVTYDGTNLRAYVNGVAKGSAKSSSGSISVAGEFTLGDTEFGATGAEKQVIDQLAIYNVAISEATAKAHYEKGISEEVSGETIEGKASLAGTGAITAKGTRVKSTGAKVEGVGAITCKGEKFISGKANVTGTGTVTSAGKYERIGKATVAGVGSVTSKGFKVTSTGAKVEGTSLIEGASFAPYVDIIKATSGLQSYWKFDESSGHFLDSKGSNNSTVETSIGYSKTSLISSEPNTKAIELNAATDVVKFGDIFDFAGKSAFTVELWLKINSLPSSNAQIISKNGTNDHYALSVSSTGKLKVARYASTFDFEHWYESAENTVEAGKTYYITFGYSGAAVVLRVNSGSLKGSTITGDSLSESSGEFKIGNTETENGFKGVIDEVAVYNVALTNGVAQEHYDAASKVLGKALPIEGKGAITAKGGVVTTGKATVAGTGAVTTKGIRFFSTGANLAGTSSVTAKGLSAVGGAANINGTSSVTSKGVRTRLTGASVSGTGTVVGKALSLVSGKATVTGTGFLIAASAGIKVGKATITGTGTVAPKGFAIHMGSGSVAGTGTVSPAGLKIAYGEASVEGAGLITPVGLYKGLTGGTITGSGSITGLGFTRQYLTNPPTYLFIRPQHRTLGLEKHNSDLDLDPAIRHLALDDNETELILDNG